MLACAECGRAAENDASGWRAYREDLPGEDDPPAVAVFCPACAAREFDAERGVGAAHDLFPLRPVHPVPPSAEEDAGRSCIERRLRLSMRYQWQ